MTKPVYKAKLCSRDSSVKLGNRVDLFNIDNPRFYHGQWINTSPTIRIETVESYIVEIETENSIYEIVT